MNPQERFRRRGFLAALIIFTAIVLTFVGYLFAAGRDYVRVSLPQRYWLLVRECEDSTAAAIIGQSYVSGGAGFLYEAGGRQTVALACYYEEATASSVSTTMAEKGVETRVIPLTPSDFELNGNAAAQQKRIAANADTVDTCAKILYDTANGLERAELSQEGARAAVRGVVSTLRGLAKENTGAFYESWNTELVRATRKGVELSEGILFAKDLRYLQIQLSVCIVNAGNYFA